MTTPTADTELGLFVVPVKAKLHDAEDLVTWLRELPDTVPIVFDAREVADISAPYVLTVVSAIRTRAGTKPPIAVMAPAAPFVDAFSDLGLFQDLMQMEFRT